MKRRQRTRAAIHAPSPLVPDVSPQVSVETHTSVTPQPLRSSAQLLSTERILGLQRSHGNQYVTNLLHHAHTPAIPSFIQRRMDMTSHTFVSGLYGSYHPDILDITSAISSYDALWNTAEPFVVGGVLDWVIRSSEQYITKVEAVSQDQDDPLSRALRMKPIESLVRQLLVDAKSEFARVVDQGLGDVEKAADFMNQLGTKLESPTTKQIADQHYRTAMTQSVQQKLGVEPANENLTNKRYLMTNIEDQIINEIAGPNFWQGLSNHINQNLDLNQTQWLVLALDVFINSNKKINIFNGQDKLDAAKKVIFQAKRATSSLNDQVALKEEVLRVSGWMEKALTNDLAALDTVFEQPELQDIKAQYARKQRKSGEPTTKPLNEDLLRKKLPSHLIVLLEEHDPGGVPSVTVPLTERVKAKADFIQKLALSFYSPYAVASSASVSMRHGWKYSENLSDLETETMSHSTRMGYLHNRAGFLEILGLAHYRSDRDKDTLDLILEGMLQNGNIVALVDRHLKVQSRTDGTNKVHLQTRRQQHGEGNEATLRAQWDLVYTLCHELMHVMVHPKFDNLHAKVEDSLVISEGFVEVLGFELYNHLLRRAMTDEVFRESISEGFAPGPVPTPRPRSELGYGEAAQKAAHIMDKVGEKRFTAAFFLGQHKLVGID